MVGDIVKIKRVGIEKNLPEPLQYYQGVVLSLDFCAPLWEIKIQDKRRRRAIIIKKLPAQLYTIEVLKRNNVLKEDELNAHTLLEKINNKLKGINNTFDDIENALVNATKLVERNKKC